MSFIDPEVVNEWMTSQNALGILFALSFSESSFFFIPPEVMLIPMALAAPENALMLGAFTTFASVLGASFGYFVGKKGGRPILHKMFSKEKTDKVQILFKKYDTKAIIIAAFTPIPFKVFTISAGVFDIDFKRFIIASAVGRGARYMLLSILIMIYGEAAQNFLLHQFDKAVLIGTVLLIGAIGTYKIGIPFIENKVLKMSIKDKVSSVLKKK